MSGDPGLMAPQPPPGARIATFWTVEEYPASGLAPAHFRLLANGQLLGWGPVEHSPAIVLLVRLAAAGIKLVPSHELRAELALSEPPPETVPGVAASMGEGGDVQRRRIAVPGDWRTS